ncbi:PAS domain S-box protein [Neobacillus niacini]|uniref:PAS domain S-box protein n=1 Tax=Neobacillus niacini TaxID=86668 RepID=UPI00285D536A|nr:PAS domain S-box protein [Neobacillus niacini]MDR7002105.1 two-component system sporulation sensor kinase A [Neobacillus niacini]
MDSHSAYRTIYDFNLEAIMILDLNGYFVQLNESCERILGYSSNELMEMKLQTLTPIEDLEKVYNTFNNAIQGHFNHFDCKIIHKNGQKIDINITYAPIIANNEILGIYGVVKDITAIKQKNEIHRNETEIHRLLIENSLDIIIRTDLEGKLLYATPACEPILGLSQEELIGTILFDLIHKEDQLRVSQYYQSTINGKQNDSGEYRLNKKDGSFIWIEAKCKPIIDPKTQCVKEVISVVRDITQRKLAEDKLNIREERYRNLVEQSPDAVIIAKDSKIVYMNDTGIKLFGASEKEELIGKSVFDFLFPEYVEMVHKRMKDISNGMTVEFSERKFHRLDGNVLEAEVTGIPTIFQNETAVHLIVRDIAERKRTQELLLNSEKLSVAGQLAAGIAHEVRNPLTAIKGFLQLMDSEENYNQSYFKIIGSEINRIELILSELLTLAKPQDMKVKENNLKQLLEHVKSLIDTQAIMKNIEVEIVFQSKVDTIICDENQLKQVFINILKNSIEAMPNGGNITITVEECCTKKIRLLFKDTGEGIPPHIIKRIGEPFISTKEKGTGLGLMISKQIIENHKGNLHFWNTESGTNIEVILPINGM